MHAPPLPSLPDVPATGRQTGTGSAQLSLPAVSNAPRSALLGYRRASLFQLVARTSLPPLYAREDGAGAALVTLDEARRSACGPVCLFPEATTSNGRGLLRFAEGFGGGIEVPVRGWKVWVVYFKWVRRGTPCAHPLLMSPPLHRHPPPSPHQPSATHASPNPSLIPNPLSHIFFSLLPTLLPRTLQVKILHPDSSLSSGDFLPSAVLGLDAPPATFPGASAGAVHREIPVFSECVAALLVSVGRTKRLGLGWEDKVGFVESVEERRAGGARKSKAPARSAAGRARRKEQ